jgi:hypothetical protein
MGWQVKSEASSKPAPQTEQPDEVHLAQFAEQFMQVLS